MSMSAQPYFPQLARYAARGRFLARAGQDQLVKRLEELGEHDFQVDLGEGHLRFVPHANVPPLVMPCHLIASIGPGPRSVLWGWAHPRGDEVSNVLRRVGETEGIPELCQDEVPFPAWLANASEDEVDGAVAGMAHELAEVAVGITGRWPYYSAPNGKSRVVFVLDPRGTLDLSLQDVSIALPRYLSEGGDMHDESIRGLAQTMGWQLTEGPQEWVLSDGRSTTNLKLDHLGRITNVSGQFGGQGPMAGQGQTAATGLHGDAPSGAGTGAGLGGAAVGGAAMAGATPTVGNMGADHTQQGGGILQPDTTQSHIAQPVSGLATEADNTTTPSAPGTTSAAGPTTAAGATTATGATTAPGATTATGTTAAPGATTATPGATGASTAAAAHGAKAQTGAPAPNTGIEGEHKGGCCVIL